MKLVMLLLIISFMIFSCEKESDLKVERNSSPNFNLMAGTYNEDINITLSSEIEDAVIYYTLDDSEPNKNSSIYNSPLEIKKDGTSIYIKAFLVNNHALDSEITTSYYKIDYSYNPDSYNKLSTLEDFQEQIIGKWIGKKTNWREEINVEITFNEDGSCISKSLTPIHNAFHYTEEDGENTFYLYDVNADGSAMGILNINDIERFDLNFIKFSENLNVINFESRYEYYDQYSFTLTRVE